MPDPNQNNQNSPGVPNVSSSMPTHTDFPPLPDFMSQDNASMSTSQPSDSSSVPPINQSTNQPVGDTGSGAPPDLPPMIATPKKKFGGGKIVATVLGIFLLVGGIGAGILLIQQPQIFQPKAVCDPTYTCSPDDENVCKGQWFNSHGCTCAGTKDCSGEPATPRPSSNPGTPACPNVPAGYNDVCTVGGSRCQEDSTGKNTGYNCSCVDLSTGQCTRSVWQCTTYDTNACSSSGPPPAQSFACDGTNPDGVAISGNCLTASKPVYMARYTCLEGTNMAAGCSDNPENFTTTNLCADPPSSNWCGTVQVDYGQHGTPTGGCSVSRKIPCSSPNPTTPPKSSTPTPGPTAVCQNVKAYNGANWVLLNAEGYSYLKAGDKVNFCVTGSASSGAFDKAKFTVNSVAQAETTTVRPSSTDFCQSYTIPASVTTFNVTAQIHHVTLGWK